VVTTREFAAKLGICVDQACGPLETGQISLARSVAEIATRAVILHGVVSVAAGVDGGPVVSWLTDESLWRHVTAKEKAFLLDPDRAEHSRHEFQWHKEAEWTLLWAIQKVGPLGLPTHQCDTRRLVDEIMPALNSNVSEFVESATLRNTGEILAEDNRTYDLWCRVRAAINMQLPLPADLNYLVLYERRYAFEWLDGDRDWDDVTCDA